MLEASTELVLRDIARRLVTLMEQVRDGDAVDNNLLDQLNIVSEQCYIKHIAGHEVTLDELSYMSELIDLLEMRTTLIYKNPPKS